MLKILWYSANPASPAEGYWDQALLRDLLANPLLRNFPDHRNEGAIVVIPGPYQADFIDKINKKLGAFKWVLLMITSDEEGKFPVERIKHPNIKIWVQYPKQGRHDNFGKLPLGYTGETQKHLALAAVKDIDVFYSAQNTHERRSMASDGVSEATKKYDLITISQDTPGFTKGYTPEEYMHFMARAKVAPSPAGPVSADAFRTYEALEAGATPIADNISLAGDHDYWNYLFGSVPFACINNYEDLPGYINDQLQRYPEKNNRAQAWWIKKKRDLMWSFIADIEELSGILYQPQGEDHITVIIPVSPIKSHPSVEVLEKTIKSIRHHLPTSEIIITFDGVRPEQSHMRANYEEFIRQTLWLCNVSWNAVPIIFDKHTHQVGMARVALEEIKTPVILYCEQDTPLVTDEPIEWKSLWPAITLCDANVIRLHFEARIPEEHQHLMLQRTNNGKGNLLQTIQWSQRPHLASTDFYKHMLKTNFSKNARCFIEDKIHSVVQQDYAEMGFRGWDLWKLFIYWPEDRNIKRSLNLDGREGEPKYDDKQIF